jgi:hypothetical protein
LHNIRIRGAEGKSGNAQHPADDPLWDLDEVVDLYVYRAPLTENERKERVKERNRANYTRSKDTVNHLKEALPTLLAEKKISKEEADKLLVNRSFGAYRLKEQHRTAVEAIEEKEERIQSLTNSVDEEKRALRNATERLEQFDTRFAEFRNYSQGQTECFALMFQKHDEVQKGDYSNYLQRNGFSWPTEASVEAFFEIYAICVPMGIWEKMEDPPSESHGFHIASLYIHPDKASKFVNAFPSPEFVTSIFQIFVESRECVQRLLGDETVTEERKKAMLKAYWESAKHKVFMAMRPRGDSLPSYYLAYLTEVNARKTAHA